MFGTEDLFAVGIGFDIAGAVLVAWGLLAGPRKMALRAGSYYGSNPNAAVGLIEDRVRGDVGVVALVLGFSLQAAAYAVTVAAGHLTPGTLGGIIASAAVPAALILLGERWTHDRRARRLMVRVARYDSKRNEMDAEPSASALAGIGKAYGLDRRGGESDADYIRRHFGVVTSRE
jgi:hypothetical protein